MNEQAIPQRVDAVVIGSGALGASTAFHLASSGLSVALLDKADLASQTSRAPQVSAASFGPIPQ